VNGVDIHGNPIESPTGANGGVRVVDTFDVDRIVSYYAMQESIDVGRFFQGPTIDLLECVDTGYRFFSPASVAGDESFYETLLLKGVSTKTDYDREWSADHEFASEHISDGDTVLEIGCSTGKFLNRMTARTTSIQGLELNEAAAKIARSAGLNVSTLPIEEFAQSNHEQFDVVCMFQVLEHVYKVAEFLKASLAVLKPGGTLILSVPNNDPYFQRFGKFEVLNMPPHHVGLWNLASLAAMTTVLPIRLETFRYSGTSSFRSNLFVRAKHIGRVPKPSGSLYLTDRLRMAAATPLAVLLCGVDLLRRKPTHGHISVRFRKLESSHGR
jgi:2-polyprenyl-3-methyl-5-hydroxy-6-metoxy-1,4-benzoquinol methylase